MHTNVGLFLHAPCRASAHYFLFFRLMIIKRDQRRFLASISIVPGGAPRIGCPLLGHSAGEREGLAGEIKRIRSTGSGLRTGTRAILWTRLGALALILWAGARAILWTRAGARALASILWTGATALAARALATLVLLCWHHLVRDVMCVKKTDACVNLWYKFYTIVQKCTNFRSFFTKMKKKACKICGQAKIILFTVFCNRYDWALFLKSWSRTSIIVIVASFARAPNIY